MILSNIQGRGLLKGVLSKGGGGGGVTDYNQLSSKPQINGVTIENNHDGGYYGLIDSVDIEVTEIYEIGYGSNYDVNLNGAAVHVTNKIFKGATNSTNGTKGLVPAPAAGSVGKILSNEGWIDPPASGLNIDVLWSGSETPTAGNPYNATVPDISNYKVIIIEGYSNNNSSYDQSVIFLPQLNTYYEAYQYGDCALYWRATSNTTIELNLFTSANMTTYTRILGIK